MADIDSLEIKISAEVDRANASLDRLIDKLGAISSGIQAVGKINNGFSSIESAARKTVPRIEDITARFNELSQKFQNLGRGFTFQGAPAALQKEIDSYTNALEKASLKKQELEMAGKISGEAYADAVRDVIKYENVLESLRAQLDEMQTEQPQIDFTIHGIEEARAEVESIAEEIRTVSIPESAMNYNASAMTAVFGDAAADISNYAQAVERFGQNAGLALNNSTRLNTPGIEEAAQRVDNLSGQLRNMAGLFSRTGVDMDSLRQKIAGIAGAIQPAIGVISAIGHAAKAAASVGITAFKGLRSAISGIASAAVRLSGIFGSVLGGIGRLASGIGGVAAKLAGLAKGLVWTKSASKGMNVSLAGGFKTVLKYAFGIRSLYILINRLRRAMIDAFKNLAQYSPEVNASLSMLKSSLGALKNSFATAFAPILNAVAPALSALIDMATRAFNAVGRLLAALTGKSFAAQAVKNYSDFAAGLKETGDAAKGAGEDVKEAGKEAKAGIRSFDELKTISMPKAEDAGKGAGGAGDISPADMFTTVPVDGEMKEFADRVREIFGGIFDVFERAWESKGKSVIDSAKSALSSLGTSALSVGQTFYDVFTNGTGLTWLGSSLELLRSMFDVIESISAAFSTAWNSGAGFEVVTALSSMLTNINGLLTSIGDSFSKAFSNGTGAAIWANILGIITGVYNTIGNLAKSIQTAWEKAGLGDSIWQGILNIANTVSETLHNIADATAEWAAQVDFTSLLESIDKLLEAIEPLAENIGAGLEWFWNNVLLPISTWAIQDAFPAFLDMIAAAIEGLNTVIEVFKPIGEWLWNELLLPLGEWAGGVIIDTMDRITAGIESFSDVLMNCQIVSDTVSGALDILSSAMNVITETVLPGLSAAWDGLIETLTGLGKFLITVLAGAWNNIITPALQVLGDVVSKVTEVFGNLWNNVLVPLGSFLGDVLEPVVKIVADALSSLWKNVVVPLAQAIGNVLGKAFNGICEIFNRTVIPIVNSVIKVFQFLWKNVFSPIVSFLDTTLRPVFSNIFKSIGEIINDLSKTFGGLIDFITGVFTGNWSKAWNGIKDIFFGIWNALKDIIRAPINAIIGFINGLVGGVVDAINGMIGALNKLKFTVPDWVPKIGGKSIGFSISQISAPGAIPYLAKGAVFKGGSPFLAWVNDQPAGKVNVEAPLETIQKALREELWKFADGFKVTLPELRYNAELMPGLAGGYGNIQGYGRDSYRQPQYGSMDPEVSAAIGKAVYDATYRAVSSAISNSRLLNDWKADTESGHNIVLNDGTIAGVVQKAAGEYYRRTGKPFIPF